MNRDALVVGINRYPGLTKHTGNEQHLETPARDAEAIAQRLEEFGGFRVRRLPECKIEGKSQVHPKQSVTAKELKTAIAQLFTPRTNSPLNTALLFFSGHGLRDQVGITEGYLATSDSLPSREMWGVSLKWLRHVLAASAIPQQIVWLDCCYGGEFFNVTPEDLKVTHSKQLHYFISASRDFEVAYSNSSKSYGALTEVLLKGLDPRKQQDGVVSNLTLSRYVQQQLTTTPQQPIIQGCNQEIILACTLENKYLLHLNLTSPSHSSWLKSAQSAFNTTVRHHRGFTTISPIRVGGLAISLLTALAAALLLRETLPLNKPPVPPLYPTELLKTYKSDTLTYPEKIQIKFPQSWQVQTIDDVITGTVAKFIPDPDNQFGTERLMISVEDLSIRPMTLDEYTESLIQEIKRYGKAVRFLEQEPATLANRPAYKIVYTTQYGQSNLIKLEIWTLKHNKAYSVIYSAEVRNYEKFLEPANQMINSFKIIEIMEEKNNEFKPNPL
ncbi:caspase domain protein [Coleofasciculus chthonoplastes PCC 7420]|uniref:Caspase domain protein n=1 Tax=Coleofasciculus chthonoplastes PCC 7420 TaxID=118168 RepID=B4VVF2_9CYAN|nr:caspase family protein [Coleofasciculus chthonoplastes]EDX74097.1 caspase domain protein [Coleofasciculus chthonoplastes PCC 7420]